MRYAALVLVALMLYAGGAFVGCAADGSFQPPPVTFEVCYVDAGLGKVCAAYSKDKGLFISADVTGSPELESKIYKWAQALGWKGPD